MMSHHLSPKQVSLLAQKADCLRRPAAPGSRQGAGGKDSLAVLLLSGLRHPPPAPPFPPRASSRSQWRPCPVSCLRGRPGCVQAPWRTERGPETQQTAQAQVSLWPAWVCHGGQAAPRSSGPLVNGSCGSGWCVWLCVHVCRCCSFRCPRGGPVAAVAGPPAVGLVGPPAVCLRGSDWRPASEWWGCVWWQGAVAAEGVG